MNRKLRNRLFTLHTWLGLHFSIFFFFLFLTGSLLAVGAELDSVGHPAIWSDTPKNERTANFTNIYNGIKNAYPESEPYLISRRPAPWLVDRTYGSTGSGEQVSFWTDPKTGEVVDVTSNISFQKIARELHVSLMTGIKVAYLAVCATSVVLLFQIISGLITYRRFWKGFFRWPSSSGGFRSQMGGFHRLTAIWATPLLLISAVTSFYFLLGELGFEGTRPEPQPPVARASKLPTDFSPFTLSQAEASARTAMSGFEPVYLYLPTRKTDGFEFVGYLPDVPNIRGFGSVVVDPKTFEILGAFTPDDSTSFARWRPLVDKLHYGFWGGAFSKALWLVLGLSAAGGAFTGAMIFAAKIVPDATNFGPLRRIWLGLGVFRWAYLLLLVGVLLVGYLRFGPPSYGATRVFPEDAPNTVARLLLREPLRRNSPIDIELRVREQGINAAQIEINGGAPQPIDLILGEDAAWARFQLDPVDKANNIITHLKKLDGSERTVTFRLGRPIW